jgi:hypothetical protein
MVTNNQIPDWAPIRLNTTYFKEIIPQLTDMYPNNLMEINVYATSSPNVTFITEGL